MQQTQRLSANVLVHHVLSSNHNFTPYTTEYDSLALQTSANLQSVWDGLDQT